MTAGWPAATSFPSFETLWSLNQPVVSQSCTQFKQPNNSPQETADLKNAILSVGNSTGVDARFILSIMMQESKGCVRVWSTEYSMVNPGLFQSHTGTGTCNTGKQTNSGFVPGVVSNPCPSGQILQMVEDGVKGTSTGLGLQALLTQAGDNTSARFYKAARMYNSGSVAPDGNLGHGVATHCYSSDVANRLLGKFTGGPTGCKLDTPSG